MTLKKWLIIVVVICLTPLIAIMGYDFIEVRPRLPIIQRILQTASSQDRNPPTTIKQLIDVSFGNEESQRDAYVTRLILDKVYKQPLSQGTWHKRIIMWQFLLPLHFSQNERYAIYSTLSPNGIDEGLNAYANRNFNKNIDQLNEMEAAITVANVHAPSRYQREPELLKQQANYLLQNAKNE